MKIFPMVLVALSLALSANAQTNSDKYVPNGADMRIVEGKMYNRALSTNWVTLPTEGTTLTVADMTPEGVVVASSAKPDEKMMVKNCPGVKKLTKGGTITNPFRAMPVAPVKYGDATVAAYDCGLANNKENRKTLVNGPIHAEQP